MNLAENEQVFSNLGISFLNIVRFAFYLAGSSNLLLPRPTKITQPLVSIILSCSQFGRSQLGVCGKTGF
jgi:hypothetical protein